MRWISGWAVAAAVLSGVRSAGADALDEARANADAALVRRLESLASWAETKQVAGFRHRVFRTILLFAPDHRRARTALKYARAKAGDPWVQSPDYREPADWNRGNLGAGERRLAEALQEYKSSILATLDAAPDLPAGRRAMVLESLVDLMPQDADLRRARGDVEFEGRWVLPETAEGETNRAVLLKKAREMVRSAAAAIEVDASGRSKDWAVALKTDSHAVWSNGGEPEARQALVWTHAADRFAAQLVGANEKRFSPRRIYLLHSTDEARRLLEQDPAWASALRDVDRFGGLHLPDGEMVTYREDARLNGTAGARQVVDACFDVRFPERQRGWITEGVGQRICWYVTGVHGPHFVSTGGTDEGRGKPEDNARLPEDAEGWLRSSAAALGPDPSERLSAVLTMQLNAMGAADVLSAYGLAAYLMEARPASFVAFVEACMRSDDARAIVHETFEIDLAEFAWRLRRWLLEAS